MHDVDVLTKKAEYLRISRDKHFAVLDHMTSHDPYWPLMTLIDLQSSIIVSITIAMKIGMLHIKRKPKTVLQRKHV